jgi:hypothetical protein
MTCKKKKKPTQVVFHFLLVNFQRLFDILNSILHPISDVSPLIWPILLYIYLCLTRRGELITEHFLSGSTMVYTRKGDLKLEQCINGGGKWTGWGWIVVCAIFKVSF